MKPANAVSAGDKLAHCLAKYATGLGSSEATLDVDSAVDFLLKNYPEYKRQDADYFKQSVASAISKRQSAP